MQGDFQNTPGNFKEQNINKKDSLSKEIADLTKKSENLKLFVRELEDKKKYIESYLDKMVSEKVSEAEVNIRADKEDILQRLVKLDQVQNESDLTLKRIKQSIEDNEAIAQSNKDLLGKIGVERDNAVKNFKANKDELSKITLENNKTSELLEQRKASLDAYQVRLNKVDAELIKRESEVMKRENDNLIKGAELDFTETELDEKIKQYTKIRNGSRITEANAKAALSEVSKEFLRITELKAKALSIIVKQETLLDDIKAKENNNIVRTLELEEWEKSLKKQEKDIDLKIERLKKLRKNGV